MKKCLQCPQPPLPGKSRCQRCTDWVRDWHARRRAARLAALRCVTCGEMRDSKQRCVKCLKIVAIATAAYRDRKNPDRARKPDRLNDFDTIL